jgi:hypothetical protein
MTRKADRGQDRIATMSFESLAGMLVSDRNEGSERANSVFAGCGGGFVNLACRGYFEFDHCRFLRSRLFRHRSKTDICSGQRRDSARFVGELRSTRRCRTSVFLSNSAGDRWFSAIFRPTITLPMCYYPVCFYDGI